MAEKLNNPYYDESTDNLQWAADKISYYQLYGWPEKYKNAEFGIDSLLHHKDLMRAELKRRKEVEEHPDQEDAINARANKYTQEIFDGNDYRKRHGEGHSGWKEGDRTNLFKTGAAWLDHDPFTRGQRATVDWLGRIAEKWTAKDGKGNDTRKDSK